MVPARSRSRSRDRARSNDEFTTQLNMNFPRRGEIYLVSFDPTVGHEIQKTRPAVVIQNDFSNQYSPITIVAAVSSQFGNPPHPREVLIAPGKAVWGSRRRSSSIKSARLTARGCWSG
jgi:mRNA-degrading endonuclease toxin of MazEF toxin-antitoxin module